MVISVFRGVYPLSMKKPINDVAVVINEIVMIDGTVVFDGTVVPFARETKLYTSSHALVALYCVIIYSAF